MIKIGIDLGGTKIEGIALSAAGEELFRYRIATPQGDYEATMQSIADLIKHIETTVGANGSVGICTPGALSPSTGLLRNSNSVCLNGKAVLTDLQEHLQREIRIANDANCFALSEAVDGAAKNARVVFGVIIGTGTGAGIVIDKKVLVGSNAIAGEWGHNPLPWPEEYELHGAQCYCGKYGCIETWLSGPGMMRDHGFHNTNSFDTGRLDAKVLNNKAQQGDKQAIRTFQRYENRMARSLAHIINILDPDVIVLGGGMSNIKRLYKNVPELWGNYVFSDTVNTKLLAPVHGDSSGVRGAAWLWNN
jgi:fructokinase